MLLGGLLFVFTAVCFVAEPDACAAVTAWPPWAWAVPGLLLTLLGCRSRSRRFVFAVLCAWAVYGLVLSEEPKSMLLGPVRNHFTSPVPRSQVLRIASLNCAVGNAAAANEVIPHHPDVVLLQESPSRRHVEVLGQVLFGKRACVAWGADCSVIAEGDIIPDPSAHDMPVCANAVRVRLKRGVEALLMSVRLSPPVFGTDFSSSAYWRAQTAQRRTHRRELRAIATWLDAHSDDLPVVAGGDFNAPGWDGALKELPSRLRDTFLEAGIGCGNTVLNDLPVLRFDQIWASRGFRVLSVRAYETRNSDHRLVVCDLALPSRDKE